MRRFLFVMVILGFVWFFFVDKKKSIREIQLDGEKAQMPLMTPSKHTVPSEEVPSASLQPTQKSEIYEKQANNLPLKDSPDPDIKYKPQFPVNTQVFKEFSTLPTLSQSKINFLGINCWLASPSGLVDASDLQFRKLQIGGTTGKKLKIVVDFKAHDGESSQFISTFPHENTRFKSEPAQFLLKLSPTELLVLYWRNGFEGQVYELSENGVPMLQAEWKFVEKCIE